MDKMSIIVEPPDCAVLSYDAIFHMIQIASICRNLLSDIPLDNGEVLRVNQAGKGISGVFLKFCQILAAEYPDQCLVGIDQPFFLIRMINKETAGHPGGDLLNNRESLLAEDQSERLSLLFLMHKNMSACSVVYNPVYILPFPDRLSSPHSAAPRIVTFREREESFVRCKPCPDEPIAI